MEIADNLLKILHNYPNYDYSEDLAPLMGNPKTQKIARFLNNPRDNKVSVRDFVNISSDFHFLFDCGLCILRYGKIFGNIFFLNLAIKLFQHARNGISKESNNYNFTQVKEANACYKLGELGFETEKNIKKALKLYGICKEDLNGDKSIVMEITLEEIRCRIVFSKMGFDSINNLNNQLIILKKIKDSTSLNSILHLKACLSEGIILQTFADRGYDSKKNLEKSLRIYESAKKRACDVNTIIYARMLINEGIDRSLLAYFGENPYNNEMEAINLYQEAIKYFDQNSFYHCRTLMNEGISWQYIANRGIDSVNNHKKAIDGFNKALDGFDIKSNYFLRVKMNEALSRKAMAELGINPIENLKDAINLCEEVKNSSLPKNSPDYVRVLGNEALSRKRLAEFGISSCENLKKAIVLIGKAREKIDDKNSLDYSRNLINEAVTRIRFAEMTFYSPKKLECPEGTDCTNFIEKNLYKALELIHTSKELGINRNDLDYAKTLMNEGRARSLIKKILKKSVESNQEIERTYEESRRLFEKLDDDLNLINVLSNLGSLYKIDDKNRAYRFYREAIDIIEKIRSKITLDERKEYFETVVDLYKDIVFICLSLEKYEQAFKYAESAKGKTFLELLTSEKEKISDFDPISDKIDEIKLKISKKGHRGANLENEIEDLEKFLETIKSQQPEYYSIKQAEPIALHDLYGILDGKTLLEYFVGEKLALFIINPYEDGKLKKGLRVEIKDISEHDISKMVLKFREIINKLETLLENKISIEDTSEFSEAQKLLAEFYDILIKPVKKYLGKEIVIVPHSYLHLIPFQALKSEKYLIEENKKISFALNSSSLKYLKKNQPSQGALVIGNPLKGLTSHLRQAEEEANEIAKIFNEKALIGREANKQTICSEIRNKKIIHFACHGSFNPENPALSGIMLSDGFLNTYDFMNSNMKASLTVLSACETAVVEVAKGDEVEGLVRSIQYAGSRFVVASLWKVADESTKDLFIHFYNGTGDLVDNLRGSELELMKEKGFYYWAPFQIYGI